MSKPPPLDIREDRQICEHCTFPLEEHDYQHLARDCYPKQIERLRAELAAVRHHLEAAYEAMGVPLIMSRPLSCYINDLRKELAAERAARIAVASPVRQEGEP